MLRKFSSLLGYVVLNVCLFFPDFFFFFFFFFLNVCFNAFQYSQSKITGLNKIWPLKGLAMLKFERATSLDAVQYK